MAGLVCILRIALSAESGARLCGFSLSSAAQDRSLKVICVRLIWAVRCQFWSYHAGCGMISCALCSWYANLISLDWRTSVLCQFTELCSKKLHEILINCDMQEVWIDFRQSPFCSETSWQRERSFSSWKIKGKYPEKAPKKEKPNILKRLKEQWHEGDLPVLVMKS